MQRLMEEHDHLFPDNHIDIRKWRNESHDRWLIIDDSLYHCGHSLNANGGHKISAITLMGTTPDVILSKVEQQLSLPAVPSRITNCFSKSSPCGFIPAKTILARALMPRQPYSAAVKSDRRSGFLFSPEGRRPRREVEPSLRVRKDGQVFEKIALIKKGKTS